MIDLHEIYSGLLKEFAVIEKAIIKMIAANYLDTRNIHTVVVTGLITHGCVQATCLDARELGYRVILVADGHSNYHREAARVIDECHQTLTAAGVELAETNTLTFGQPFADRV